MSAFRYVAISGFLLASANCTIIPNVPNDYAMPINDIIHNTTCELRDAFDQLNRDRQFASFKAGDWLIGLTLTPKTDREVIGGAGLTGKSTSVSNAPFFNSWAFGSAAVPGALGDVRGTRNAGITYNIHSRDLLNIRKFPLACDPTNPNFNALAQHLGIREWLIRTARAEKQAVGSLTQLDKPTFSSEIYVKFTGSGNFTYNFPFGTDFAALSGSYDEDITFSIALTQDQKKGTTLVVQSLPTGGNFGNPSPQSITTQVNVGAQARLDSIEAQQQIVNQLKNINSSFRGR